MNQNAHRLFHTFIQFRKLHFSSLITEMNHSEFSILKAIAYDELHCHEQSDHTMNEKISTSALAKKLRVSSPSISRSLKGLEEKEYVTREVNPSDRRNTYVILTPLGKEKMSQSEQVMMNFTDNVIAQMDPDHLEKLIQYMQDFFDISQKELDKRKDLEQIKEQMEREQSNE